MPADRLSKKKHRIPARTNPIVIPWDLSGLSLKNRKLSRMIQTGAEYCRTIAFPAVVSLFAMVKKVVTPAMQTAPVNTVKFHLRGCCVRRINPPITQAAIRFLTPLIVRGFQGIILIRSPPREKHVEAMAIISIPRAFCGYLSELISFSPCVSMTIMSPVQCFRASCNEWYIMCAKNHSW